MPIRFAWIPSTLLLILCIIGVYCFGLPVLSNNNSSLILTLLNTIGQSLATIFALFFTTILIGAQLISSYTYRVWERVFSPYTIAYLIFFVALIIYIFLLLNRNASIIEIQVALILTGLAMSILLFFLLTFKNLISLSGMIAHFKKRIVKWYQSNEDDSYRKDVLALVNIAIRTVSAQDYDNFNDVIDSFENICVEPNNDNDKGSFLIQQFELVAFQCLRDDLAPLTPIASLGKIGNRFLEKKIYEVTDDIIESLTRIATKAVEKRHENAVFSAIESLENIGKTAIFKEKEDAVRLVVLELKEIGSKSIKYKMVDVARGVNYAIRRLSEYVINRI